MKPSTTTAIEIRIAMAREKYGPIASTHEAMGVALEEWHEFIEAVRSNDVKSIKRESLDMAAVLIRLHDSMDDENLLRRSIK